MRGSRNLWRVLQMFSSTKRSYYDILGINKTATQQQIKKSFYKIAQQLHPDKNPDPSAKEKFAEANNAYEILSDVEKKRQYDGTSGFYGNTNRSARASGFTGGSTTDPFQQFSKDYFRDRGTGFYEGFSTGGSRKVKGQDITKVVDLSFVEAAKGTTMTLKYEKVGACTACNGNKCKPGTAPTRCMSCGGSGTSTIRQGAIVMHIPCSKCQGIGLIIKNPCTVCKATGILKSQGSELITIPAGSSHGETIKIPQKGNKSENGPDGDLFVQLNVKSHPKFRRKGNDIESTEFLTISQAVLGHKATVETMYGNKDVVFPAGCQDGQKITIKGLVIHSQMQGIHRIQPLSLEKGDHLVVSRVKIPKTLTPAQKQLFMDIAKTEEKIDSKTAESEQAMGTQDGVFGRFKNIFK